MDNDNYIHYIDCNKITQVKIMKGCWIQVDGILIYETDPVTLLNIGSALSRILLKALEQRPNENNIPLYIKSHINEKN